MNPAKITSTKDIRKTIEAYGLSEEEIKAYVRNTIGLDPCTLLRAPWTKAYLTVEERGHAAIAILNDQKNMWLQHVETLMNFIPHDQLRDRVMSLYKQSPWYVQTQIFGQQTLFSGEFFQNMIEKIGDFQDSSYFEIFLLFNAHHEIDTYSESIRSMLKGKIGNTQEIDVHLLGRKEPGFACGGMEKNYKDASKDGNGICIVNNSLLAKYFHRKGNTKKVSYLPIQTYTTKNGHIIWADYFYSPSQHQHQQIIEAIAQGEKSITINKLSLKAVRPVNKISSREIFNALPSEMRNLVIATPSPETHSAA